MADPVVFRLAVEADFEALVAMIVDDEVAAEREQPVDETAYRRAFAAIVADANNELMVGDADGAAVAVLQLTFIPGLTYAGGTRAQIEGVRVHRSSRGRGVGRALIENAVARARARGCVLVQLTTDVRRPEAVAFYEGLGFRKSHVGMKLRLS